MFDTVVEQPVTTRETRDESGMDDRCERNSARRSVQREIKNDSEADYPNFAARSEIVTIVFEEIDMDYL